MAKAKATDATTITLSRLDDAIIEVPIVGLTAVIPHRWSEKSRRMMPGHPDSDTVKRAKDKRKPKEEADACLYLLDGELAMPATAFKAAIVGACRFFDKPSMVEAKQLIFVEGKGSDQLVPIDGEKEGPHEDLPRNSDMNRTPDLRYRYYIQNWSAVLRIRYTPARISGEAVVALADAAGRGGIGEWRPSAPKSYTGTFGTWRVDLKKEVRHVTQK